MTRLVAGALPLGAVVLLCGSTRIIVTTEKQEPRAKVTLRAGQLHLESMAAATIDDFPLTFLAENGIPQIDIKFGIPVEEVISIAILALDPNPEAPEISLMASQGYELLYVN